jgi:methylthioribose-1-phosphate isomerase
VRIIDQRRLPGVLIERDLRTVDDVCDAIDTLAVRGSDAIGIAGAMGLVASMSDARRAPPDEFRRRLRDVASRIRRARPTAANLAWAVDRLLALAERVQGSNATLFDALRAEAGAILDEDRAMCRRIGEHGLALLHDGARVLTHCNAGALATGGIGTALAPIYLATERGQRVDVFATETRPLLQGSRLTAWELMRAGIHVTLLADSMVGSLMARGLIDMCLVGGDRVAANGDVANKIGTYSIAVLAGHHGIPFYVAVAASTIDPDTATGADIPIEERSPDELLGFAGQAVAAPGVATYTPAFDITPATLVSAIVTDQGVRRAPFDFTADRRSRPSASRLDVRP